MTYGQICNASLQLLHQFSLAGEDIPETYNNQADYIRRIPPLVDDAQFVIASGPRRIRAAKELLPERGREEERYLRFTLPEDLMEIMPGGLFTYGRDGDRRPIEMNYQSGYVHLDERHILVEKKLFRKALWLEYYRRPASIAEEINAGVTQRHVDVEIPSSAETICVAGKRGEVMPIISVVINDAVHEQVLSPIPGYVLDRDGKMKQLDYFSEPDLLILGPFTIPEGAESLKISGWAGPGNSVLAFYDTNGAVVYKVTAPTEPAASLELDNDPDAHRCIPYYVAAHLVMQDDAFAYASLYNEWQNLLGSLYRAPTPHRAVIEDAYGDPYNHYGFW